jgi:chromosome partitioning protein
MTRRLAVVNQKGGAGKTSTAVTVAACAAENGRTCIVIDLDPQGSATKWLDATSCAGSVMDILTGDADITGTAVPSVVAGVDVAPGR